MIRQRTEIPNSIGNIFITGCIHSIPQIRSIDGETCVPTLDFCIKPMPGDVTLSMARDIGFNIVEEASVAWKVSTGEDVIIQYPPMTPFGTFRVTVPVTRRNITYLLDKPIGKGDTPVIAVKRGGMMSGSSYRLCRKILPIDGAVASIPIGQYIIEASRRRYDPLNQPTEDSPHQPAKEPTRGIRRSPTYQTLPSPPYRMPFYAFDQSKPSFIDKMIKGVAWNIRSTDWRCSTTGWHLTESEVTSPRCIFTINGQSIMDICWPAMARKMHAGEWILNASGRFRIFAEGPILFPIFQTSAVSIQQA